MTTAEKCRSLIPLYGIIPMLMLLEEYEAGDQYEECAAIVEGIRLNGQYTRTPLPTTLTDAFFLEVDMKMTQMTNCLPVEVRGRDYWEPYLNMLKTKLAGEI
jgi:hypothetical protein